MKIYSFNKKSVIQLLIGILISILFIYLTISKVNINDTLSSLGKLNYLFLIPAILIHMVGFVIRTKKWNLLLVQIKSIPFVQTYKILVIGFMFNNILPFRLGEIARSHLLGIDFKISRTSVLGTIFIEKLSDAIALILLILVLGLIFVQSGKLAGNILYISLLFLILSFLTFGAIIFEKKILSLIERLSNRTQRLKVLQKILMSFINGLKTINSPIILVKLGFLSVVIWIFEAMPYYIISQGFDFKLNFLQILLVCSIVNLSLLIPSSPGYIGTFHFFCVAALGAFGISQNIALSYAIITHLILWIPITLLGIIFFILRQKKL